MDGPHDVVDKAMADINRLLRFLKKGSTKQVQSQDELSLIKATAYTWFMKHKPSVAKAVSGEPLGKVDELFKKVLEYGDRATSRSTYTSALKATHEALSKLRSESLVAPPNMAKMGDDPPDFSPMIRDETMRGILVERWSECSRCVAAGVPLAATVMMGGLLEALLLARVHREPKKDLVFKANRAPKDGKTGKTLRLEDWTLKNYIDVAHELGWITQSAKDVGEVLRDYRNYVHPYKALSHGVKLGDDDAVMFWEIAKSISKQVLRGAVREFPYAIPRGREGKSC